VRRLGLRLRNLPFRSGDRPREPLSIEGVRDRRESGVGERGERDGERPRPSRGTGDGVLEDIARRYPKQIKRLCEVQCVRVVV